MGPRAATRDVTPGAPARKAEGRSSHAAPRDSRAAQTPGHHARGEVGRRGPRAGGARPRCTVSRPRMPSTAPWTSSRPPTRVASTRLDARGRAVVYAAGALACRRPPAAKCDGLCECTTAYHQGDRSHVPPSHRAATSFERMCLKHTGVVTPGGRSNLETRSCTHKDLSALAHGGGSLSHSTRRVKRAQFANKNARMDVRPNL